MKNTTCFLIQVLAVILMIGSFATQSLAQNGAGNTGVDPTAGMNQGNRKIKIAPTGPKAGIGFVFGTVIQQHQQSNFKQGVGSYFRLNLLGKDESNFFIHTEQAAFNAEEGDAVASGTKSAQGIGASLLFGPVSMEVVVGSATVKIAAATGTGTAAIGPTPAGPTTSTDPIADIGVKWNTQTGDMELGVGLAYRLHRLSTGMVVTDSSSTKSTVYDMGSSNINIGIGYNF